MGRGRVRLRDIAEKAHVSTATVSLVLNNKTLQGNVRIGEQTIRQVKRIAREMGYWTPGQTTVVGLVVPALLPALQIPMIAGISEVFTRENYCLAMGNLTRNSAELEISELLTMDGKGFDGLIMEPSLELMEKPDRIRKSFGNWKRMVLVNRGLHEGFPCVAVNQETCGYLAARHLLELGHRKIAFAGPVDDFTGPAALPVLYSRFRGYCKALEECGLSPVSVERAEDLFGLPEKITAVYCCRTLEAAEFMGHCWDRGIRIPEELSVVAQGDEREKTVVRPRLTSIGLRSSEMGLQAARMVLDLIRGRRVQSTVLEPELIVRESTRKL